MPDTRDMYQVQGFGLQNTELTLRKRLATTRTHSANILPPGTLRAWLSSSDMMRAVVEMTKCGDSAHKTYAKDIIALTQN
jgi:hypothetical protein